MSLQTMMNHVATIERQAATKSATGGVLRSWTTRATAVPCRVDQIPEEAAIEYGRLGIKITHRIYLVSDKSLTINDRITVNGASYNVRSVEVCYGKSSVARLWQVDVERKSSGDTVTTAPAFDYDTLTIDEYDNLNI